MQQSELDQMVDQIYMDTNGILKPIYDGVINEALYFNSKARILWVLFEPYDKTTGRGGWNSRQQINDSPEVFYKVVTWRRVAITTYGIINNCSYADALVAPDVCTGLKSMAYININKLPAATSSSGRKNIIRDIYTHSREVLLKQIEFCNPNIIILGGTVDFLYADLKLHWPDRKLINGFGGCAYHLDNSIVFAANHPSFRKNKYADEASYCGQLIKSSLEWLAR